MSEMILWVIRTGMILLLGLIGACFFSKADVYSPWHGAGVGLAVGFLLMGLDLVFQRLSKKAVMAGALGVVAGLFASVLLLNLLAAMDLMSPEAVLIPFVMVYLGGVIAVRSFSEKKKVTSKTGESGPSYKILDTSVIIDGRVSDIADTGFLDGALIIPKFVLAELQHIADSPDSLKRNRGRRGLDVLNKLQKDPALDVRITDRDFPATSEVDAKLVLLAKELGGAIVTNDFNLNKVAELQGVKVLNINDLTNALKPVVLPGEQMKVTLLKEGKEASQAVAYLEDGTMVVVDNGRNQIGKNVDVVVTSSIQTAAGRMIFTKLASEV